MNHFLFDYVPLYSKFRAPSSILSVTAFLIPLLGILAVSNIVKQKNNEKEILNALKIAVGIMGAITLFFGILGPEIFDFTNAGDARYENSGWSVCKQLLPTVRRGCVGMLLECFALILFSAGLIWTFLKGKIKQPILIAGLGLLSLFDLWSVGKRYLDNSGICNAKTVR